MGYLKLMKAGTEYDLLPAEGIISVTSSGQTNCVISYSGFNDSDKVLKATLVITNTVGGIGSGTEVRKRINDAISAATANQYGSPTLVNLLSSTGAGNEVITSTTMSIATI